MVFEGQHIEFQQVANSGHQHFFNVYWLWIVSTKFRVLPQKVMSNFDIHVHFASGVLQFCFPTFSWPCPGASHSHDL